MTLSAYLIICLSEQVFLILSILVLMFNISNSRLHSSYTHKFPIENSAICFGLGPGPLSFSTTSSSVVRALFLIRLSHSLDEFLTKLPSAPAALALVFSSSSFSSPTIYTMHGFNWSYRVSLWNPALPTAKQANLRVFLSESLQHSIASEIKPCFCIST